MMTNESPEIETLSARLAVLDLRPDDLLVLMCPDYLSHEGRNQIRDSVTANVPGHKVMVLEGGMTLGVVRAAP
jgi:hypothetical protein